MIDQKIRNKLKEKGIYVELNHVNSDRVDVWIVSGVAGYNDGVTMFDYDVTDFAQGTATLDAIIERNKGRKV